MTSLQIQYFLHLCTTRSFSETARQLFVAQPAVSKQIAALERELGISLFVRTNRGVELTPGGEQYCAFFSDAQQRFHRVQAEVRRSMEGMQTQLTLGILESLGLDEVSEVIAALRTTHPEFRITVARLDHSTLLERFFSGALDAVITFDHALERHNEVRCAELLLEQSCFLISRAHPLAKKTHLSLSDLSGQAFCETRTREGVGTDSYLRRLTGLLNIEPGAYLTVDNLASGLAAVENDLAVGLIDERVQLLHPEQYRFLPTGTYQSIVCASMEANQNPYIDLLVEALKLTLRTPKNHSCDCRD